MNYFDHDKFPNHDAVTLPCIVYVRVVDNYYFYSACKAGMPQKERIPRELGEWFKKHWTRWGLVEDDTPVRFRNVFDRENYPRFKIKENLITRV